MTATTVCLWGSVIKAVLMSSESFHGPVWLISEMKSFTDTCYEWRFACLMCSHLIGFVTVTTHLTYIQCQCIEEICWANIRSRMNTVLCKQQAFHVQYVYVAIKLKWAHLRCTRTNKTKQGCTGERAQPAFLARLTSTLPCFYVYYDTATAHTLCLECTIPQWNWILLFHRQPKPVR